MSNTIGPVTRLPASARPKGSSLQATSDAPWVAPDVFERASATTDGGPLRLIITAPDTGEREQLKKLFLDQDPQNLVTVDLPIISGFAVEVSPTAIQILPNLGKTAHDARVFLDNEVSIPEPSQPPTPRASARLDVATHAMGLDAVWDQGFTGKGMTIAVIDTGIAPHPDLKDHVVYFHDYVNGKTATYDDNGHGTHVSSICAGTGQASQGRYKGCAPEANLIGLKALDKNGKGSFSKLIQALDWAVANKAQYHIDVINMSVGAPAKQSYKDDPLAQAVEAAVAAGIVTCVAAGNDGPSSKSINTPGHALDAFTVGALDDQGSIDRSDDSLADFSGRGPTPVDGLTKPDILAPGVDITAADYRSEGYRTMSGTSMATPMVAGTVACLRQARPDLTPAQIKTALMKTATSLPDEHDPNFEGSGSLDAIDALAAVQSLPKPPTAA